MPRASTLNTNARAATPLAASQEQAPALPSHIQAVGTHHRLTKGSGYYWIGPAHSVPLNDKGLVLKGIVLYNATTCLFLERDETQEAIEEAQRMLHSFFEGSENGQMQCPPSEVPSKSIL